MIPNNNKLITSSIKLHESNHVLKFIIAIININCVMACSLGNADEMHVSVYI